MQILIVEDDKKLAHNLASCFSEEGHEVRVVYDGYRFRSLLNWKQTPDAIIVDLHIPNITTRELLESVLTRWPGVKVYTSSGYVPEHAEEVYSRPVECFIKGKHSVADILKAIGEKNEFWKGK